MSPLRAISGSGATPESSPRHALIRRPSCHERNGHAGVYGPSRRWFSGHAWFHGPSCRDAAGDIIGGVAMGDVFMIVSIPRRQGR